MKVPYLELGRVFKAGIGGSKSQILMATDGFEIEPDYDRRIVRVSHKRSPRDVLVVPFEAAMWREELSEVEVQKTPAAKAKAK